MKKSVTLNHSEASQINILHEVINPKPRSQH